MSDERFIWRFRMVVCSVALTALAMIQAPGRIVSDTKIDLPVDPGGFLSRALSLWDPIGGSGQVQNQAYGYFFPMGPFFWIGHRLGFDPWIVQRLWWALIFVVAFLGFVALVRALGIGSGWAQLIGGLAFALSPRILSVVGPSSIEVWPAAVAPWVLLPLVVGMTRRSPVLMAALSAIAVACVGGVNAAATFAVIPLGAIWLVMGEPGRRRRAMMLTWPIFIVAGTLWWLIPLFVLGAYSPPFLNFIESAALTTFAANLTDTLSGTSNWTSYLSNTSVAGRLIITNITILCNIAVVTALGIVGLARRDNPRRAYLFMSLLVGVVLVTLGHTATHGGFAAPELQSMLDGKLAPLRNTHKFDVVVRLPLAIGFVHVLTKALTAHARLTTASFRWTPGLGVAVLAVASVVGATMPAWSAQLPDTGTIQSIPNYWNQTSQWLAKHSGNDRALLVPASSFGDYIWGRTKDDPMQPLAKSPWAVRNAIPLGQPGYIGSLDAIESRFSDARGSEALAKYLADAGIGYLVVRNDLKPSPDGLDPEIVYATLEGIPSLTQVAAFGPSVGGAPKTSDDAGKSVFIDGGWQSHHRAIEIYRVPNVHQVRAQYSSSVPVVIGSPESQLSLLEAGLLISPTVLFAQDANLKAPPRDLILTDGQRRQEAAFGRSHNNRSNSLGAVDTYQADRPVHNYDISSGDRWLSVPVLRGAKRITASSSDSWVNTTSTINQSSQPWSAFDSDSMTAWTASRDEVGKRSWIEIEFDEPTSLDDAKVTLNAASTISDRLSIETDRESTSIVATGGDPTRLRRITRPTRTLRISAASTAGHVLSIADISIPAAELSRPLELPAPAKGWESPDQILLSADQNYRDGCLEVDGIRRCVQGRDAWGEDGRVIDRLLHQPTAHHYQLSLTVEPIGGSALDELIQRDQLVAIRASSQIVRSAQASALNATDGDPTTAWIAAADDERPRLSIDWVGKRSLSSIRLALDRRIAASRPTQVTLVFSNGARRTVILSASGRGVFPKVKADGVEIRFDKIDSAGNLNSEGGGGPLPVGVGEVSIGSGDLLPRPVSNAVRQLPCGSGPTVRIGSQIMQTRVRASPQELLRGNEMPAQTCGSDGVVLPAGMQRITVAGSDSFRPVHVALRSGHQSQPAAVPLEQKHWGSTNRSVVFPQGAGGTTMTIAENFNTGWTEVHGAGRPIMVNGWQQGWQFSAGPHPSATFRYAPNSLYRGGLVLGAGTLLGLLLFAFVMRGRCPVRSQPIARNAARAQLLGLVVTVCALIGIGGVAGLTAGLIGYVLGESVRRWIEPAMSAALVIGCIGFAAATRPWAGAHPWFGTMDWPQLAIACAFGLMAGSVFGRPKRLRLLIGRSTIR